MPVLVSHFYFTNSLLTIRLQCRWHSNCSRWKLDVWLGGAWMCQMFCHRCFTNKWLLLSWSMTQSMYLYTPSIFTVHRHCQELCIIDTTSFKKNSFVSNFLTRCCCLKINAEGAIWVDHQNCWIWNFYQKIPINVCVKDRCSRGILFLCVYPHFRSFLLCSIW
jgi:hypothetical protein